MTPPPISEDPDSRTSSVGRKRGFGQLSATDDTLVTIEGDSSDEVNQPREKRPRCNGTGVVNENQLNSTIESSPEAVIISDSSESAQFSEADESIISTEEFPSASTTNGDADSTANVPPAWNPGVSVTIRTSLTDCTPQAQVPSTPLDIIPEKSDSQQLVVPAVTIGTENRGLTERSSHSDMFGTFTAINKNRQEGVGAVDARHISERDLEVQRLQNLQRELQAVLKKKPKKKSLAPAEMIELSAKILAQLPSSFGTPFNQKEAEKIIKDLPEDTQNLMPRQVAHATLYFKEMERTFTLPEKLHGPLFLVPLGKLSFCNPLHSFVSIFLEVNQSLLEFIDYELLRKAFQEYLKLLYGHLPDRLTSMVFSSKHVVHLKAQSACSRHLAEARKMAERSAAKVESRRISALLAKIRNEAGAVDVKLGKIARGAMRAEMRNATGESRVSSVSRQQPDSGAPRQDITSNLPLRSDSQSHRTAQISQDQTAQSMTRTVNAQNTAESSSNEKQRRSNQDPHSKTIPSGMHTEDNAITKQELTSDLSTKLELIRRYHPSSAGATASKYCLTCAKTDHETSYCPSLTCNVCGLHGVHFTAGCSQKQRCTRCHERGHQKPDCPEKLAATADEPLRCDICSSAKHLESACHFLWRSFVPDMLKTTKIVADIPIHCYACGAAGHFGSECGIRHSLLHTDGYSWSRSNWRRYVDPDSHDRALSAGKDFSLPVSMKGKKSFSIRGSAQGNTAPMYDDENISFIRERISKPARPVPKGNQPIKLSQSRPDHEDYNSRPHVGPPIPELHGQPPQTVRRASQQKAYVKDRYEFSYRPQVESARHLRERSFSPPPRFYEDQFSYRPGDNYNRMEERIDSYRSYDRGRGDFGSLSRAPESRGGYKPGPLRARPAQRGRSGASTSRGKRQRNRND